MCGIAGFLDTKQTSSDVNQTILRRMTAAISHRGPDDEGIWQGESGQVNLGFRRLSIIDLSITGRQPMSTPDGRWTLIFNGEIYNYRAIRGDLASLGCRFVGTSDTEVLLTALARWGVQDALVRLNGMFAFALWDAHEQTLYLARDRFGEKPLYYSWHNRILSFGSELKALSEHPGFCREVDHGALALLARFNYVSAPQCIFKGTHKLQPGHFVVAKLGEAPGEPRAYWSLAETVSHRETLDLHPGDPALIETVDSALREAVKLRMAADVPLGAFLSGGIDSSTIVALMQAQSSQPIKTFTIGFWATPYNEAEDAARVARHLGTDHHEHYLSSLECQAIIERIPDIYDEPFADSSQIPTTLVSEFTRRHVTVALSGDAGDELFGGYNRYVWGGRIWPKLTGVPTPLRHWLGDAIRRVSPSKWEDAFSVLNWAMPRRLRVRGGSDKLHKLSLALGASSSDDLYEGVVSQWQNTKEILKYGDEPPVLAELLASVPRNLNFVERMMYLDALTYLPDDILCKVDRASMSVGLEARVPFLDNDLVKLVWGLPVNSRIYKGIGKWPLRQVLNRYVPSKLFDRPKAGFGVPIGDWLRGPLRNWAEDLLSERRLEQSGCFKTAAVRQQWNEHVSGRYNREHSLWSVMMFQAWADRWKPTL